MRFQDITSERFGRLVAIKKVGDAKGASLWLCKCDCGKEKIVRGTSLTSGATKSCGCLQYESRFGNKNSFKHGDTNKRLYTIYCSMIQRCYNTNANNYERYGGRGIQICDEWLGDDGYIHFREWAMNNGYSDNLSIDRKDNNKGYFPDNCRWATNKEQSNNKRNTVYLTFNGETHCITEWADIAKISSKTLKKRIKLGWNISDVLTKKLRVTNRTKNI